ncbi:type II 3-dehydroquinate dehydratase [Lagierella massiliensis]|uniref:type II 3-dehydroquinate dehydratase n=1 Tax=Lagierella massiliensis TaxID=1689303 RepID=UPI0006D7BABB|nr:type II 3-dehydroquinate dehydratase [Lagierella massiliensis]
MKLLVVNGPNINMLGVREPEVYGDGTYIDLCNLVDNYCREKNIEVEFFQSNYEGEIVDIIQNAYGSFDGIIINPAAYTHTSIAILDSLKAVGIPTVEVHISDVSKREDFRQVSYIRQYCKKSIIGFGFKGYLMAVDYLVELIKK